MRSRTLHLKVVELPYVKQLDLEYRFPTYTGLAPRTIEDGGDVATLQGHRRPTADSADDGRVERAHGHARRHDRAPLTANADGTLGGNFIASANGSYRVELDGPAGEKVAASPQYTIDMLADQAPSVTLSKPGRDTDATPVQEFVVEARADDDFAVKNLQLVYSINGGPEKTIGLFSGSKPTPEVTAGHTFYLEELGVAARRRRVVLRARRRQRRHRRPEAGDERHLFPAHPAVRQGLQAGHVDGRRRRRRRRRRRSRRACRSSSGRSSPARSRFSAIAGR